MHLRWQLHSLDAATNDLCSVLHHAGANTRGNIYHKRVPWCSNHSPTCCVPWRACWCTCSHADTKQTVAELQLQACHGHTVHGLLVLLTSLCK